MPQRYGIGLKKFSAEVVGDTASMLAIEEAMESFQAYVKTLAGDEKGEAHVFCDRLFQAFGHAGY